MNDLWEFAASQNRRLTPEIAQKARQLRQDIAAHDRLYYLEHAPRISDRAYDRLLDALRELEQAFPELVTPDSPTQRVSEKPATGFPPARHDPPMLSLDNTYAIEALRDFDRSLHRLLPDSQWTYVVEPKVDGVAFCVRYHRGQLDLAATRGDGETGDAITANVKTIRTVPLRIPADADCVELRGEVFMPRAAFAELARRQAEAGREPFKNARNAAAGSLKLLDPRQVADRPLDALFYATGALQGIHFDTQIDLLNQLQDWGLRTAPWFRHCAGIDAVIDAIDDLDKQRHMLPFDTDGAVIKVNERALYGHLGATARSPRWARAYKFASEQAETILESITVQVGRTGVLTPVAELRTVRLAGSDISRATLHNAEEIARKDIRAGDHVIIEKAGEVIPAVIAARPELRQGDPPPFRMPSTCPACQAAIVRLEGEVAHRCVNPACPAQRIARLEYLAARNALDIEGLGGRVAETLVDRGWVRDPLDIFDLDAETLATLNLGDDRHARVLGKPVAQRIVNALERSRQAPLERWLLALGIPGVGETIAGQVAACHADLDAVAGSSILRDVARLYEAAEAARAVNPRASANPPATEAERLERAHHHRALIDEVVRLGERLQALDQAFPRKTAAGGADRYTTRIRPDAARSILAYFDTPQGAACLNRLKALGITPRGNSGSPDRERPFAGKTVVITGTLSGLSRSEAAAALRRAGATVTGQVSRNTDWLILGDAPGSAKRERATSLAVPIMTEAELLNRLNT